MTYEVIVTYNKYPDHVTKSTYYIDAPNADDAKRMGKDRFSYEFSFDPAWISARVINEVVIEYKNRKP
jgi:hypothetical protein